MANRRFEMYQYRQIIHCMRMGQSDRTIAQSRLIGRIKCAQVRALALRNGWLGDGPLPDDAELAQVFKGNRSANSTRESLCERYKEQIEQWLAQGIQATTIFQALVDRFGFTGSYSSLCRLVRVLRDGTPNTTCILDFSPGEAAQVDFGKGPDIIDAFTGKLIKTWVFVMTLCFSRHMYAEIVADQKVATWLGCHRRAFEFFTGVPAKTIIDNAKCAIVRACYRDPQVQRSYAELAQGYGFIISPCPPRDPKKKGRVESAVKYVKKRFVPLRSFRSLGDANAQLTHWVMQTAGNRTHGTTREKPLSLFAQIEKPVLRKLPDVPVQVAVWAQAKLHSDCHVRFENCLYSAPYRLVNQPLWLKVVDNNVKIYHDLQLVAVHPRQKKSGQRSTVDDHLPPEAIAYKTQDPQWCLHQAEAIGASCRQLIEQLFSDRVLDNMRAAQGVIGLGKKYGPTRLEQACKRALFYDNPRYGTVKSILQQGLDQMPLPEQIDWPALSATYSGAARFIRPAAELQLQ